MPINTLKIKELRQANGMSQQQAAEAAGLKTRQAFNRIEGGGQPNLGIQQLERIAKALGVQARDLLTDAE